MTALHRAESRAYRTLRAHSLSIQRDPDLNCLCSLSVAIKYVDSPVSALGLALSRRASAHHVSCTRYA